MLRWDPRNELLDPQMSSQRFFTHFYYQQLNTFVSGHDINDYILYLLYLDRHSKVEI